MKSKNAIIAAAALIIIALFTSYAVEVLAKKNTTVITPAYENTQALDESGQNDDNNYYYDEHASDAEFDYQDDPSDTEKEPETKQSTNSTIPTEQTASKTTEHQHKWVHHAGTGHNEIQKPAWDEPIVELVTEYHFVCRNCNFDFGASSDAAYNAQMHIAESFDDDCTSYFADKRTVEKITGYTHHEAEYVWIQDSPDYTECVLCKARK